MKFDPNTKMLLLPPEDVRNASINLMHAIKHMRKLARRPLEGAPERYGPMDSDVGIKLRVSWLEGGRCVPIIQSNRGGDARTRIATNHRSEE